MQYLRRRTTADAVSRDVDAIAGMADGPVSVSALSGRLHDAVLVELLSPGEQVGTEVAVPREHVDGVLERLRDARERIETLDRIPIGLIDVRRSRLYRRGDASVDGDAITSAAAARDRLRDARRREMKLLTATASWSIFLGTAAVLAGGVLDVPVLLGVGIGLLVAMIPAAIAGWQFYRGVKDHLLDVRYRHEAETLVREIGDCEVHVRPGRTHPSGAGRPP